MTTTTHQAGDRVQGTAQAGDIVTYSDMANQGGAEWVVLGVTPGLTGQYCMARMWPGQSSPEVQYSDLRQRGWTFAR